MPNKQTDMLTEIAEYYTAKLAEHGETARGVDWNGEESQALRFEPLCKIIAPTEPFTINDLGCGYGALNDFLLKRFNQFDYTGIDVSKSMILSAQQRHQNDGQARFLLSSEPDQMADYGIASGIFNVRMGRNDAEWTNYVETTIEALNNTSRAGFAFNCLTSYSDANKMRDELYYADPCVMFDLCKTRYSRNVAILHDYGLYEFTVLVRKQL